MRVLFEQVSHTSRSALDDVSARLKRLGAEHSDLATVHVSARQLHGRGDRTHEVRLTGELRGAGSVSVSSRAEASAVALREAAEVFERAVRRRRGRRIAGRHTRLGRQPAEASEPH